MYPPPQSVPLDEGMIPSQQVQSEENTVKSHKSHMRSHSHAHPAPFAYEYVFEEGKMPFLAELHPMKTKDMKAKQPTQETVLHSGSGMQRQRSLKRKDRQLHFDIPTAMPTMQSLERTTSKLKRAFSLSGIKSTQSKYFPSATQEVKPSTLPMRNDSTRSAPPGISPPIPDLILPTPSPSPEPFQPIDTLRNSVFSNSSSAYRSVNFSLPRSSWASSTNAEDQMDLQFVRETAQGRFSPNPAPTYGMRRNKALAILGITEMPLTPPYTPSASAAPSIYDSHSRLNSRRPSVEYRLSQLAAKDEKPLPSYPIILDVPSLSVPQMKRTTPPPHAYPATPVTPEGEKTPKAAATVEQPSVEEESPSMATPRPVLKRKTSKFIEHLDNTPEIKFSIALPKAPVLANVEPVSPLVPLLEPPTRRIPLSSGLRRSESMRTPSPRPGPWGNVVCMAEARPIVAMGTARLITS
jgi:hypothetical protein